MKIMPLELSPRLILDFVDVVLVGIVGYGVWRLIRGTRAVQLLKGLFVLAVLTVAAYKLQLHLLKWTLEKVWTMAFVAVPVIFQPEIRRVLEKLGQGAPFLQLVSADVRRRLVQEVAAAAAELSRTRTGALIAFERRTGLKEYMEIGVVLDALVSRALLLSIFEPHNALHDGAVLIAGDRIVAAACFLPLAAQHTVPPGLGARHRAAVGLSEQTDALVAVVSEETGRISVAENGRLTHLSDASELEAVLKKRLFPEGLGKLRFRRNHRRRPFETGL